ncbi:MAG: exonuclease domain-containing protein, partial [Rubrivivax sp.]
LAAFGTAIWRRRITPLARLAEQVRVRAVHTGVTPPLVFDSGDTDLRALAAAVGALVTQRDALRAGVAAEVAHASHTIERERSRLAALMSKLSHSVVVCNLDGRVLLYNQRARQQFRSLSEAPPGVGGSELIGLGRSIYAVFDRQHVAHALDIVQRRRQRGEPAPSATFVTALAGGRLLRAVLAPVREGGDDDVLSGFVLLLDDITREHERERAQDDLLLELTDGYRASIGSLQAAVGQLDDAALDAATRERLLAVVRDEVRGMGQQLNTLAACAAQASTARWPLEDMLGADLVEAAQRRIEAETGVRTGTDGVDAELWLKADSFALLQALVHLAQRLHEAFAMRSLWLRLAASDGGRAQLDLIWSGQAVSSETLMAWETEPMRSSVSSSALSVRDVLQRHGGECRFARDRAAQRAFFRLLLPLADETPIGLEPVPSAPAAFESRPEYYDFDLFAVDDAAHHDLDARPLAGLSYTVFDTETTGLEPSGGDEILQIGAARIVNGRLLQQECFEQLVDPRRHVPAAGIAIHGIGPDRLVGQPTIDQVLPAFHAYARDTVLVAHNAAFDMRFLQLKEAALGLHFDQPVLDTLLLSALVHPNQASHRLESIAERFGIAVVGRHTALGDALVTAEVFLRLLPLLAALGIHTLAQAREASQRTYYARLRY